MITAKVTGLFFDRRAVIQAVGAAKAKALSKAGAYIRTSARSSMRRRKAASAIGSPPSVHSHDPNASLKKILFAWDPSTESVVVGPVTLNHVSFLGSTVAAPGRVPGIQEFGGKIGTYEYMRRDGTWQRADLRSRRRFAGAPQRIRQATYPKRPYMAPAMMRELPKFPDLWKNAVIRGM